MLENRQFGRWGTGGPGVDDGTARVEMVLATFARSRGNRDRVEDDLRVVFLLELPTLFSCVLSVTRQTDYGDVPRRASRFGTADIPQDRLRKKNIRGR